MLARFGDHFTFFPTVVAAEMYLYTSLLSLYYYYHYYHFDSLPVALSPKRNETNKYIPIIDEAAHRVCV